MQLFESASDVQEFLQFTHVQVQHMSRLTSLFFIGLVEARVDVLVMSAFNRASGTGRIGLQWMFGVMDALVTR